MLIFYFGSVLWTIIPIDYYQSWWVFLPVYHVFLINLVIIVHVSDDEIPSTEEQELWKKSYQSFESGIVAFEEVNDAANVALLYCNLGQLMRVCAHAYAAYAGDGDNSGEFTQQEKHYYNKVGCEPIGHHTTSTTFMCHQPFRHFGQFVEFYYILIILVIFC